jgi:hypothetical protein
VNQPHPASALADMIADLRTITEAQANGATWAQIGATLGMTGRGAKKHAHRLREQVKQELQALSGRLTAAGARNGGFQPRPGDGEGLGCGRDLRKRREPSRVPADRHSTASRLAQDFLPGQEEAVTSPDPLVLAAASTLARDGP